MGKAQGVFGQVVVSIVTHNSECKIRQCYDALNTHLPGARVCVVDSASTDGTVEALGRLDNLIVTTCRENVNYARGHNLTAASVEDGECEVFVVLNDDAVVTDSFKHCVEEVGKGNYGTSIVGPRLLRPNGDVDSCGISRIPGARLWIDMRHPRSGGAYRVDAVCGACMVMHARTLRFLLKEWGYLFDPWLISYKEDVDLCLRAGRDGIRTILESDAVVYHERGWKGKGGWRLVPEGTRRRSFRNSCFLGLANSWSALEVAQWLISNASAAGYWSLVDSSRIDLGEMRGAIRYALERKRLESARRRDRAMREDGGG